MHPRPYSFLQGRQSVTLWWFLFKDPFQAFPESFLLPPIPLVNVPLTRGKTRFCLDFRLAHGDPPRRCPLDDDLKRFFSIGTFHLFLKGGFQFFPPQLLVSQLSEFHPSYFVFFLCGFFQVIVTLLPPNSAKSGVVRDF